MNIFLNRLLLWQKFTLVGVLAIILVFVPLSLYITSSTKELAAAKLQTNGLAPTKILFDAI